MSTNDTTGDVDTADRLTEAAMQIILAAGEARAEIKAVYDALAAADAESVAAHLSEARERITVAHRAQTEVLQAEARGERHEPSLLFAHAQDSLMVVNSEAITARNVARLFESIFDRLTRLEAATGVEEERS